MKKNVYIAALAAITVMPVMGQETYENMKLAAEDLNGTARYVGMGGALEALGADISTISTNPAGIALMRKSSIGLSAGVVSQEGTDGFATGDKTNISFDQAGFVWSGYSASHHWERDSWLNFSFNFHKSRNFDFILSAADNLNQASQNKLTYAKAKNGLLYEGDVLGTPNFNKSYQTCNQLDDIYARNSLYDTSEGVWYYDNAQNYTFDRAHTGYIGEYDINISGAVNDQVFLGLTMGISDVHYNHYSEYKEYIPRLNGGFNLWVEDDRSITGTGFNVKLGAIVRPIKESGFRIGAYVHTPTWYTLTTRNSTNVSDGSLTVHGGESYEFKLYTPWRFGLSLGHNIGTMLALGATIDYADYGAMDTRYVTDRWYDGYGTYSTRSQSDNQMNKHTKQTLKGVATVKVGAELKPAPELAIRLGYNYVSPAYKKDGFKDGTIASEGSYYSSATDYTNWEATNRITCGLGYTLGKVNLSMAYQYSMTNGNFSPFMNYIDNETVTDDNICNEVSVKNKRHQVLFSLNYTF